MRRLERIIRDDPDLMTLLDRLRAVRLPQWRIVSGCLYQTVWNVLTGNPRGTGIVDRDVIYYDSSDLSWEAEDRAIRAVADACGPMTQTRNQARVHLWYEEHFGVRYTPLRDADEALTRYPATAQAVGVRLEDDGRLDTIAPFGLDDVFGMTMRPNRTHENRAAFEAKAARARAVWPGVTVIPWVLLLVLVSAGSALACEVRERTSVALTPANGLLHVPVMVNEIEGDFILDTGASRTVVTPEAARRFRLTRDEWTATTTMGVGGLERHRDAVPRSLTLGGVPLHRRSLAQDQTLRVAGLRGGDADGLLGRDFLSAFDLAVDLTGRTLTLYDARGCAGRFLPWTDDYVSIPVETPADNALIVGVDIGGMRLRALLDTGASTTLVAAPGMARLGLGLDRLAGDPAQVVSGVGPHTVTMWRHAFHAPAIGGRVMPDSVFLVAPIRLRPVADMLLGLDWLRGGRVWISYATRQLFVTR